jgi:hypothetical protein
VVVSISLFCQDVVQVVWIIFSRTTILFVAVVYVGGIQSTIAKANINATPLCQVYCKISAKSLYYVSWKDQQAHLGQGDKMIVTWQNLVTIERGSRDEAGPVHTAFQVVILILKDFQKCQEFPPTNYNV